MDEDDDPTCIVNMLEEFRAQAKNFHRSSMVPLNVFSNGSAAASFKAKRLMFDEQGNSEISDKRQKLETPKPKDLGDEGNLFSTARFLQNYTL